MQKARHLMVSYEIELPTAKETLKWQEVRESLMEQSALLDPLFWQCLGKALGWSSRHPVYSGKRLVDEEWKYHLHRFIDHIAEGKSIDNFFNELLK